MSRRFASSLYRGSVTHRRTRPREHNLSYQIWSVLIDLDELESLDRSLWLFSVNRINVVSFFARDRGDGSSRSLRSQVECAMQTAGLEPDGGPIRLLTMPRVVNYAFNPLSVYFCYRRSGAMAAILWEVDNTFGERHGYLLPVEAKRGGEILQNCDKQFYVSPFMDMKLAYEFRVREPCETLSIVIEAADGDGKILTARHNARRIDLTDAALLSLILALPFVTFKVWLGIRWEAIKMWAKGLRTKPRASLGTTLPVRKSMT